MAEISIILPVRNGADYLAESIDSVLSQDFRDFELHILDDASNDDTPCIAMNTGDARVRYSKNPGRLGLFKTLNRGFEEANSSLVRIWCQDDRMLPGSLRLFVEFAKQEPSAAMVYCDFYTIDSNGNRTGAENQYDEQRKRTPRVASPAFSSFLFWHYGCLPGNISTVLLRREAWREVGGFLTGIQQAPDFDMWVRLSERFNVGFLNEKLIDLRSHAGQLSRLGQKQLDTIEEELHVIRKLESRLEGLMTRNEIKKYWRNERGRQHVHWMVRAFLRGDIRTGLRGWDLISRYGQPWSQLIYWLVSANGRFFLHDRNSLFDSRIRRLNA